MNSLRDEHVIRPAFSLPKNAGRSIRVQVVLGSPAAGCKDVGICRVIPAESAVKLPCPMIVAWVSTTEQGKLRFSFLKESIDQQIYNRHFKWGLFQVIEACEMPLFLKRSLKEKELWVLPGIYPVWSKPDRLIVDF